MVFYLVPIFFHQKRYFSLTRPGLKIENLRYCMCKFLWSNVWLGGLSIRDNLWLHTLWHNAKWAKIHRYKYIRGRSRTIKYLLTYEMLTENITSRLQVTQPHQYGSVGSLSLHMQRVPGSNPDPGLDDYEDHYIEAKTEHRQCIHMALKPMGSHLKYHRVSVAPQNGLVSNKIKNASHIFCHGIQETRFFQCICFICTLKFILEKLCNTVQLMQCKILTLKTHPNFCQMSNAITK